MSRTKTGNSYRDFKAAFHDLRVRKVGSGYASQGNRSQSIPVPFASKMPIVPFRSIFFIDAKDSW
jgi:hypothetical protein